MFYVSYQNSDDETDEEAESEQTLIVVDSEDEFTFSDSDNDEEEALFAGELLIDDMVDRIHTFDITFLQVLQSHQTMIGSWYRTSGEMVFVFASAISPTAFFHFPFLDVTRYLRTINTSSCVDIFQVEYMWIRQCYYPVVIIKTYWLRLVQRRWKHIFHARQKMIRMRMCISSQRYFQLHGKYPPSMRVLPVLYGMLNSDKRRIKLK